MSSCHPSMATPPSRVRCAGIAALDLGSSGPDRPRALDMERGRLLKWEQTCGRRECHPALLTGLSSVCGLRQSWAMALSFLYLAFVRLLQLLRLLRRQQRRTGDRGRHPPSRSGGATPPGSPSGAAAQRPGVVCRAESAPWPPASRQVSSSSNPRLCSAGTGTWSDVDGPIPAVLVDREFPPAPPK
jgi:hypothetical protein